jgi:hypothetical protein
MQIREIDLSEIYMEYRLIKNKRDDSDYKEFEDLIYQMHKEGYKLFGVFEEEDMKVFAIIKIEMSLKYKRYLHICEIFYDPEIDKFYNEMLIFLIDYSKINMCNTVVTNTHQTNNSKKIIGKYFQENGVEEMVLIE